MRQKRHYEVSHLLRAPDRILRNSFADGWNAAENEIEILRDQIDILKAKLKQANAPPKKEKDLSIYSVIRCFKHSDPVLLQHVEQKRKQHLEQKQMEWEDHF